MRIWICMEWTRKSLWQYSEVMKSRLIAYLVCWCLASFSSVKNQFQLFSWCELVFYWIITGQSKPHQAPQKGAQSRHINNDLQLTWSRISLGTVTTVYLPVVMREEISHVGVNEDRSKGAAHGGNCRELPMFLSTGPTEKKCHGF